jgi:integrase/recombinase XerD
MAQITPLRRRMIDDMTVRNLSPATHQSYVCAVAKFSRFFARSPDQLGVEEVRAYQIHLAGLRQSWSHINQVSCALRFFFGVTLGRQEAFARIAIAKEPKKLPVVLSADEIVRFLQAVPGLRSRAALTTAYGAGLRVSEVASLRVGDIDSGRMLIRVEHGKGGKDRYVMLSPQLLAILRAYWRLAKPAHWLFPGRDPARPVSTATLQAACRVATREAELDKPVTVHTLRHNSESRIIPRRLPAVVQLVARISHLRSRHAVDESAL